MSEFPDNFVKTLWEIVSEQSATIKTQQPRLIKMWNDKFVNLAPELPTIRSVKTQKDQFLSDISHRISTVETLRDAMNDGYFVIKYIVDTLFLKYIEGNMILQDYAEEDILNVSFLIADMLVGTLLQFIVMDESPVPIGFIMIAKFKTLMKFKPLTGERLAEDMKKNNFNIEANQVEAILEPMVGMGYIEKLMDEKSNLPAYKFIKEFTLTPEGQAKFNHEIKPLLEWAVGIWRSLFNIRSIDTPIPDHYPHHDYLQETVKRAATQGFAHAHNVMENIANFYNMVIQEGQQIS